MQNVSLAAAFAPHIAVVAGAALAIVLDAFQRRGAAVVAVLGGLLVATALASSAAGRAGTISGELVVSGAGFSAVVAVVCGAAALVIAGSWRYFTSTPSGGGLAALAAVSVAAAAAVAQSADLLVLLICLEAMAIVSYALVWSAGTDASTEAALKYFIQGAVATSLFVLGMAILFGLYGVSTTYTSLRTGLGAGSDQTVLTAFVLIAAALSYKLGAFPFHSWAPDAFESAPPHASALLAGIPKIAVGVAFMLLFPRVVFAGVDPVIFVWLFSALSIGSMAFGVFGGLAQRSFTRMLAYSGVAQIGYALIALATGPQAMTAMAVLLIAYAAAAATAFLVAGVVRSVRPDWDGSIAGMAGMGRDYPVLGATLGVAMFSLVGMPLTVGFWGKFFVFGVAVSAGYWWLALIGVIASVVSFGFYGTVLRSLYFETPPSEEMSAEEPAFDRPALYAAFVFAILILLGGVAPLLTGLRWVVGILAF